MPNLSKNIKLSKCKNKKENNKFKPKSKNLQGFLNNIKKPNLCTNRKYKNK